MNGLRPVGGAPATRFPVVGRESAPRRALARAGALWQWIEVALNRAVSPTLNPLYHTGTIAVFSLAVATVTGVYLLLFYRVGTGAAHASVEAISAQPFGVGSLVRSLHRYSSDAALVAAALHGLKMLFNDRFWGPRWVGWITGLVLLVLVWITGATGFWLIWDAQALVLSQATARLLDALPFFTEPIAHTFMRNDRIQNFLFFIVLFIHITIPLVLGAMYWLHVMRLARARFFPPRVVLYVTSAALVLASVLRPALSGPSADPAHVPSRIPIDWFYFWYFPAARTDPGLAWAAIALVTVAVAAVPWLLRGRTPPRAAVVSAACTGCTRCYKDCPYDAIVMVPRTDGARYKMEALVNPARCVGCGICVGACDSAGIVLGGEPVQILQAAVTARVAAAPAPVVVYTCRLMPHLEPHVDAAGRLRAVPHALLMGLPCVGLVHPDMIRDALTAGARGVYVAGCVPEDCHFREGGALLAERLTGARLPKLRHVPEGAVRVGWYAPVETRRLLADVERFARERAAAGATA